MQNARAYALALCSFRESQTAPWDGEVDFPKQWVLVKDYQKGSFYPGSASTATCTPLSQLVPQPHFLRLRLCSVLVKKQMSLGRSNTFLLSLISTPVSRSQWQFLSWDWDWKGGQGENEAVWWGAGGGAQLMGSRWMAEALKTNSPPTCKDSRLWDNGPGAIMSYMQTARVPVYTLPPTTAVPICDLGCVFVGRTRVWRLWKQFQEFPAINYPQIKVLLTAQLFKSELMEKYKNAF